MKRIEKLVGDELLIVREAIDPSLASDFQTEWLEGLGETLRKSLSDQTEEQPKVFSEAWLADYAISHLPRFASTRKVLRKLDLLDRSGLDICVNYQPPKAAQTFHQDRRVVDDKVIIVHGSDSGAFDYSPLARHEEDAEYYNLTAELNTGDVLYSRMPYIYHRGRNLGEELRVTATISEFIKHA
jgi:hypothetical protein